jgi:hypothetical protein
MKLTLVRRVICLLVASSAEFGAQQGKIASLSDAAAAPPSPTTSPPSNDDRLFEALQDFVCRPEFDVGSFGRLFHMVIPRTSDRCYNRTDLEIQKWAHVKHVPYYQQIMSRHNNTCERNTLACDSEVLGGLAIAKVKGKMKQPAFGNDPVSPALVWPLERPALAKTDHNNDRVVKMTLVSAESKQLAEVGRKRRVGGVHASQLLQTLPLAAGHNFPVVHGCSICPAAKVAKWDWYATFAKRQQGKLSALVAHAKGAEQVVIVEEEQQDRPAAQVVPGSAMLEAYLQEEGGEEDDEEGGEEEEKGGEEEEEEKEGGGGGNGGRVRGGVRRGHARGKSVPRKSVPRGVCVRRLSELFTNTRSGPSSGGGGAYTTWFFGAHHQVSWPTRQQQRTAKEANFCMSRLRAALQLILQALGG